MTRMLLLLTWVLSSVLPAVATAQVALPRSLESCEEFDAIVNNLGQWNVEDSKRASDGGWTEAVIRADRTPDSRGLSVRESDIDLFVKCWERNVRTGGGLADYNLKAWSQLNDLFPPTERVVLALIGLAERLSSDPKQDVSYLLSGLSLLAVGAGPDERERIARTATPKLRSQWWGCWESRMKEWGIYDATGGCGAYTEATSRWLLGFVRSGQEPEVRRAEQILEKLLQHPSAEERQIAVLASFDVNSLWDASTRLALIALKDRNRDVRLMAVRLSDAARLNEEGKPYDAELRRAIQDVARKDPDAEIRREANRILTLEPYVGPG